MTAVANRRPLTWEMAGGGSPDVPTGVGDARTVLLAGPPAAAGAESLASHLLRLGVLPAEAKSPDFILRAVADSGLQGRGGAGFPVARKMVAAAAGAGQSVLVVNGSESEPASRKDWTLLCLRPHLVLDGAALAAAAIGANSAVLHLHRGADAPAAALRQALDQRRAADLSDPSFTISFGPPRYVAGESSAIRAFLAGGPAKPAPGGGLGRPPGSTPLVQNVETLALLALLGRFGAGWFRRFGTSGSPGPTLVTLAGAVEHPGLVAEMTGPTSLSHLLTRRGGLAGAPRAVLFGGFAGSWCDGRQAWGLDLNRESLARAEIAFGCGLVGVLPWDACGLAETARLLTYLARESSGQCGPCVWGLPRLAKDMATLAWGRVAPRDVRRLARMATELAGRGACHHPDGAVALLASALTVFADEVAHHLRHGPCTRSSRGPVFPIPDLLSPAWR
ncbi:MAG TPA: NADH-ubiquinone oxidoreductase-F iron-sulfur binding region domain-containing protein [Candidatus Nanopelagicaceae bacterium]|nr:NADH-ubiquinone oxidoreductase-F iron-sulfur binding region domain-containing protein [Candidatus Nanopelagicaceae bacterium]